MILRRSILICTILPQLSMACFGQSTLLRVGRRDHVWDRTRNILYISTTGGDILRYDPYAHSFLAPYENAAYMSNGMDIDPDATALYITTNNTTETQGWIRRVALPGGEISGIFYDLAFFEGGTWDVAITGNGKGFVTTKFNGSGWVPLRELNLDAGTLTTRGMNRIRQNTLISRGADRTRLLFTESNSSGGPLFTYDATSDTITGEVKVWAFLDQAASGVNRDGTLFALELDTLVIYDQSLNRVKSLGFRFLGGLIFDPVRDILYTVDTWTDELVAIETNTWGELYRLDAGVNIVRSRTFDDGEMSISHNGEYLFLSISGGVLKFEIGNVGAEDCDDDGITNICELDCGAIDPNTWLPCNLGEVCGTEKDLDLDGIPNRCDLDLDGDGIENDIDVCPASSPGSPVNRIGGPIGDSDEDCDVDQEDWPLLATCLKESGPNAGNKPIECLTLMDFNEDEQIDMRDVAGFVIYLELTNP